MLGKDTRLSGYMLENAMVAGITSLGVDVLIIGPLPTPGVAYITRSLRADAGIVLSASHNPYEDNGIKFFRHDGYKLDDADRRSKSKTSFSAERSKTSGRPRRRSARLSGSTMPSAAMSNLQSRVFRADDARRHARRRRLRKRRRLQINSLHSAGTRSGNLRRAQRAQWDQYQCRVRQHVSPEIQAWL